MATRMASARRLPRWGWLLAVLLLAAGRCAPTAAPSASFATPTLVGSSNISAPGGSHFWFPSLSVPTGIKDHVAQHVTLSGDGGFCPPPGHAQSCDQIMLTKDGGRSYELVEKLTKPAYSPTAYVPTSGNFNGCKCPLSSRPPAVWPRDGP